MEREQVAGGGVAENIFREFIKAEQHADATFPTTQYAFAAGLRIFFTGRTNRSGLDGVRGKQAHGDGFKWNDAALALNFGDVDLDGSGFKIYVAPIEAFNFFGANSGK